MNQEEFLRRLIEWYKTLTPDSVARTAEFYAANARFIDPFNDVHGVAAIERIFRHMFSQVEHPTFSVSGCYTGPCGAMLVWEFRFASGGRPVVVHGASQLIFEADGKIVHHQDFWDPAASIFMRLPLVGTILRWLYRRLEA